MGEAKRRKQLPNSNYGTIEAGTRWKTDLVVLLKAWREMEHASCQAVAKSADLDGKSVTLKVSTPTRISETVKKRIVCTEFHEFEWYCFFTIACSGRPVDVHGFVFLDSTEQLDSIQVYPIAETKIEEIIIALFQSEIEQMAIGQFSHIQPKAVV